MTLHLPFYQILTQIRLHITFIVDTPISVIKFAPRRESVYSDLFFLKNYFTFVLCSLIEIAGQWLLLLGDWLIFSAVQLDIHI